MNKIVNKLKDKLPQFCNTQDFWYVKFPLTGGLISHVQETESYQMITRRDKNNGR